MTRADAPPPLLFFVFCFLFRNLKIHTILLLEGVLFYSPPSCRAAMISCLYHSRGRFEAQRGEKEAALVGKGRPEGIVIQRNRRVNRKNCVNFVNCVKIRWFCQPDQPDRHTDERASEPLRNTWLLALVLLCSVLFVSRWGVG